MDETSLAALGERYAAEAENLSRMITACKERRRFAIRGGNRMEAQRLESLAESHAQQRGDLLHLSAWLRRYYGEPDGGGEVENRVEPQSQVA
jgi:hypothetical protein